MFLVDHPPPPLITPTPSLKQLQIATVVHDLVSYQHLTVTDERSPFYEEKLIIDFLSVPRGQGAIFGTSAA